MLRKKATQDNKLDQIISDLEDLLVVTDFSDDDYQTIVANLDTLYKLRSGNAKKNSTELRDWLPIVGSVATILIITTFESFGNTLTSKALSFVPKPKA